MVIKARMDKNNNWGYVEQFSTYSYSGKGYVRAICSISPAGISSTKLLIGNEYVGALDRGIPVEKYVRAKKPFYSLLKDGFIVELKAYVDFNEGVYYPEKSTYDVYKINGVPANNSILIERILNVPPQFRGLVEEPLRLLGESMGDRAKFIKLRG